MIRDLQKAFSPSPLFAPLLEAERERLARIDESNKFRRHKRSRKLNYVKIGHGGTLDPMATGVLIIGVGSGTKQLQSFLSCTKTYEATVLFGVATDTYDAMGRILAKASYGHVTKQVVEDALTAFRGKIMQKPPIYSALSMDGKRLYEYAREGKEIPREIQERPMEVKELEIVDWFEASDHSYKWPTDEVEPAEKMVAKKILDIKVPSKELRTTPDRQKKEEKGKERKLCLGERGSEKRKRVIDEDDDLVKSKHPSKRKEEDPSVSMSGALQIPNEEKPSMTADPEPSSPMTIRSDSSSPPPSISGPPAVKLRMTVTSGFYVRSFSHDLGKKVGSLAIMCDLVRTRQGDFELGKNVLEYEDITKGELCWRPKVAHLLQEWDKNHKSAENEHERREEESNESDGGASKK